MKSLLQVNNVLYISFLYSQNNSHIHIRIISTYIKGTMGELSPVVVIDSRKIGKMRRGDVTARLQLAYKEAVATRLEWSTEIPPFV